MANLRERPAAASNPTANTSTRPRRGGRRGRNATSENQATMDQEILPPMPTPSTGPSDIESDNQPAYTQLPSPGTSGDLSASINEDSLDPSLRPPSDSTSLSFTERQELALLREASRRGMLNMRPGSPDIPTPDPLDTLPAHSHTQTPIPLPTFPHPNIADQSAVSHPPPPPPPPATRPPSAPIERRSNGRRIQPYRRRSKNGYDMPAALGLDVNKREDHEVWNKMRSKFRKYAQLYKIHPYTRWADQGITRIGVVVQSMKQAFPTYFGEDDKLEFVIEDMGRTYIQNQLSDKRKLEKAGKLLRHDPMD